MRSVSEQNQSNGRRTIRRLVTRIGLGGAAVGIAAFAWARPDDLKYVGRLVWTDRYPGWHLWTLVLIAVVLVALALRGSGHTDLTVPQLHPGDEQIVDRFVEMMEGRAMEMMRTHNFHNAFDLAPLNAAFFGADDLRNALENQLVDREMAELLDDVMEAASIFMGYIDVHTSPNGGMQSVWPHNDINSPEMEATYQAQAEQLNHLSAAVAKAFERFVTTARKRGWTAKVRRSGSGTP